MAKHKRNQTQTHQYTVRMRLTYATTVTVEATTKEEAMEKAEKMQVVDDGLVGAELINHTVMSSANLSE